MEGLHRTCELGRQVQDLGVARWWSGGLFTLVARTSANNEFIIIVHVICVRQQFKEVNHE